MYEILDRIETPADIRKLNIDELRKLCAEVRDYMITCCSHNPGHLASSLGAVELVVGFHYVFDSPTDRIVFDVGHQAYAHKILTGRKEAFASMRTKEGISGFPHRGESEYDAFGVGHSSTSVSAALGLAEADRLLGRKARTVALTGDGALTGGLAFEGLNNAGASKADLLVILNDNNQSIDKNRGALHDYLLRITTSRGYNSIKEKVWNILGENSLRRFLQRWVRSLKSWIVKRTGGDLFESLGFRYFGPASGNDIAEVVGILKKLRDIPGPRLVHFITTKGKGYAPAEADPVTWHAPGRFDPLTGERKVAHHPHARYQDVFGQVLLELAELDPRVIGITPAMAQGCGMNILAKKHPAQFFDVGIEEEHAVTFSAGLAAGGLKPFCNLYSAFSQRAYDQIIHDVALQKLPVVLCLDRAGLVGEDGATHQGVFDLAAFRSIPDTIVSAPKDELELRQLMYTAYKHATGPFIIRYPRGMGEGAAWEGAAFEEIETGSAETLQEGADIAILTIGPFANMALEASKEYPGRVGVYNFRFLKPLDEEKLDGIAHAYSAILTVEDGALKGGFYSAVCEHLASRGIRMRVEGIGVPDEFVAQARQSEQREACGLSVSGITKSLKKLFGE